MCVSLTASQPTRIAAPSRSRGDASGIACLPLPRMENRCRELNLPKAPSRESACTYNESWAGQGGIPPLPSTSIYCKGPIFLYPNISRCLLLGGRGRRHAGNADNETSGTRVPGRIWLSHHARETESRRHETRRPRTPELGSRMTWINIMLEPLQPEASSSFCDSVMTF